MANIPVKKGQLVGYNSGLSESTFAAVVINAPTILPGGIKNFDEANIPQCVDLLVFNETGPHYIPRVRHASFGDQRGWVELVDTLEWGKIDWPD